MRVAVTGTPGTGKTSATQALETDLEVLHLNDIIKREDLATGRDEERDTLVADMDALAAHLADRDDVVFESHLAHHLDADRVVVLRCHPETIEARLGERGEPESAVHENAESEALDVILAEAVQAHGQSAVHEIETTDRTPAETAGEIQRVIDGDREPSAGTVSYIDYL